MTGEPYVTSIQASSEHKEINVGRKNLNPGKMFAGTSMENSPALLVPIISSDNQSEGLDSSLPCWLARAQHDLARMVTELRQLQERHVTETEAVKRGIERAILGCRREERRLLERVEQDHRDTQQRLEQVQKENTAAARVSLGLLDQRLRKLVQLQHQVQEAAPLVLNDSSANQNLLLKEVAEFLQPWEISVSLKKVNFKLSPQPNVVVFGDIRVQEQSLSLHVGGCGRQGQMCSLHSQAIEEGDTTNKCSGRKPISKDQDRTSPAGRVIKKISLSNQTDLELEEELTMSSAKISQWLPKCQQPDWESCHEDKVDTAYLQQQGEDRYMAVPIDLKDIDDNKSRDPAYIDDTHCSPRNQKKMIAMATRKPSPSPERRRDRIKLGYSLSLDRQGSDKRKIIKESSTDSKFLRYGSSPHTSPMLAQRQSQASQSCLDLTSRGRSHSRLSQSSDEHSLGTQGDSGRAPSPADSLDSSYTFIVSPSNHECSINRGSLNYSCRLSRSAVDLTHKTYPLITAGSNGHRVWKMKGTNINSRSRTTSLPNRKGPIVADTMKYKAYNTLPQRKATAAEVVKSVIYSSAKETKEARGERGEPALVVLEEEGDLSFTDFSTPGVHLIYQFGKQGSGRADLTLPSGIHAMSQGQLFIVDCGNARIQVTDPQGNVLQQVTSPNAEGPARRCRNYFDIAVNAKGLIALSCAAERALLVFSRHGRLLQTFGGSGLSSAKDELEAPRGVTVTRLDEFLVADIRKGTLIALKLDHKTGSRLERTVVTGFHRPYLVAACLSSGMMAVSERGNETGLEPCIKVLDPGWNTVKVLGVCAAMGPVLSCPWGICIDTDGNVLVADWGEQHRILLFPPQGVGWSIVNQGLSSPRGLTLLPEGQLVVSDSMHHCIKIYQYKAPQD